MTRAQVDLARAAYALPGWRWHAGSAWRVPREAPLDDITGRVEFAPPRFPWQPYAGAIPDLSDPATGGVLLAMLAASCLELRTRCIGPALWALDADEGRMARVESDGATLAEACCALAVARGGWA